MKIDIAKEISFRTARSGGKGGQNVNKVETMVEGYFNIADSALLTEQDKNTILEKLAKKINSEGLLQVRSQIYRTQLGNKEEVIKKMNELIAQALKKRKKRIATKPTAGSKEKRIEGKKKLGQVKNDRKRIRDSE
jgi:ribosome-associated protein